MTAQSTQVGGDHYKKWRVEPHVLMASMVGPAAHIAGYLLRTKGDDDLDKALHWCKLANETKSIGLGIYIPQEAQGTLVEQALQWCYYNHINPNEDLAQALQALAALNYEGAHEIIKSIKFKQEVVNEQSREED